MVVALLPCLSGLAQQSSSLSASTLMRQVLTNQTTAGARSALGFTTTNTTTLTNGNFNTGQFDTGNQQLNIKPGAGVTNLVSRGTQAGDKISGTNFTGNGVGLTNIPPTALTGTLAASQLRGVTWSNNFHGTVTATAFSGNGAGLSGITSTPLNLTNFVWPTGTRNDGANINAYASNGVAVGLMPGLYTVTNRTGLVPGTNGGFFAVGGLGTVKILNDNTNGRIGISLTEGSFIDGLWITNEFNNFCMACVGYHGEDTDVPLGAKAAIRHSILDGDCDNVHFTGVTNVGVIELENCRIGHRDDGIVIAIKAGASAANLAIISRNNYVYPQGAPTDGLRQNAVAFSATAGSASFIDYGSTFYSSNGTAGGSATISIIGNCPMVFNKSSIFAPPGSNTFNLAVAAASPILTDCQFDPSQVLNNAAELNGVPFIINTNTALFANGVSSVPDWVTFTARPFYLTSYGGDEFTYQGWDAFLDETGTFVAPTGFATTANTNSDALGTLRGHIPMVINGVTYNVQVYKP